VPCFAADARDKLAFWGLEWVEGGGSSFLFLVLWVGGKRGRTECFPGALERAGEGLERAGRIAILPCVFFFGWV